MYCVGNSHPSNRVDRWSFGLWHFGHSLGVGGACFRFLSVSRRFCRVPMMGLCLLLVFWLCLVYFDVFFGVAHLFE